MKNYVFVTGLALASMMTSKLQAMPAEITDLQLRGDCEFDDIRVVEEEGQYYIAAFFDSVYAQTDGTNTLDSKRCTMNYRVQLAPNYQLDLFQFSVNGVYQLSERGSARLTVSHRAANGPTVRFTEFFSLDRGSAYAGDINDYTGFITSGDLLPQYQQCGSSIPLESSIFIHAAQPSYDLSGITLIALDDGVSSGYTKLCRIIYQPC